MKQRMIEDDLLELTFDIGSEVPSQLLTMDMKIGAIKAYPDDLSQLQTGADGAHW